MKDTAPKLEFKNRIKEERQKAGLSQGELAQLVGVSRNTISSIETGQFNERMIDQFDAVVADKSFAW
ncbi:MAG: helix-turn-helix domain-containing protein, partial [Clostridia bacterium]|nr:helix-turn-helix domain-containing protein [Clostridia bacterium]